jgi:UDP-N-acetylmuramate--alanine ligase
MRALADVLLDMGWIVTGSDVAPFSLPATDSGEAQSLRRMPSLQSRRLHTHCGHSAEHLGPRTDLVVFSSAVPPDNPELRRAQELGIPTLNYAQMLGRLVEGRRGLAVAGTHGKSTTAAMVARIFVQAARDPTFVFGATPLGMSSGGRAGQGDAVIVEACEYRGNFLHLRPQHAAILGIEHDHFDCYGSFEAVEQAFRQFAAMLPADGLLVVRHDCPAMYPAHSQCRAPRHTECAGYTHAPTAVDPPAPGPRRVETFGLHADADWCATDLSHESGRYRFQVLCHGKPMGEAVLRVPGRHNVLNALAAAALAHANGIVPEQILSGLAGFRGLQRRLEELGTYAGVTVVDDYAHHPTEISASLSAVRLMFPGRRVCCVFQPHQASRTDRLLGELGASLQNADRVLVADIFRAREGPARPGEVGSADVASQVRAGGTDAPGVHSLEGIAEFLDNTLRPGDVLVAMGAGDIGRIAHGYVDRFRENCAAG